MADMIEHNHWTVLPYDIIEYLENLCLSPMGVVPQRDRRPRVIVDYTYSDINLETISLAPREAMQFGHTFDRLLHRIYHANPNFGPVYMIKADLADGFYRIPIAANDVPKLAVAYPHLPTEPRLVALPLRLPMGWVSSPPYFCAVTETITDIANHRLRSHYQPTTTHRLTHIADHPENEEPILAATAQPPLPPLPTPTPTQCRPFIANPRKQPLAYVDIYVDDFVALAQGPPHLRNKIRTTLFDSIDTVLRPLDSTDASYHRKEPISVKKLHKGDGRWTTTKIILGWVLDTQAQTITLPQHRADRLLSILDSLLKRRRIAFTSWQKVLGELQSMVLALPGGRGLFSTLYTGYSEGNATNRLRITGPLRDAILDFRDLAHDLQARPTRLGEIVDTIPVAYGTADASGQGMGGTWLSADTEFPPLLWRTPFPRNVQALLISEHNPNGSITNSDLELAGQIAAQDILLNLFDCRERTLSLFTDNVSARAWQRKGSTTTLGPAAYLLRLLSMHQRHYRYRTTFDYLPGPVNVMADDASRLWHLSDNELLTHFNSNYPQTRPWRISPLRHDMASALNQRCFANDAFGHRTFQS